MTREEAIKEIKSWAIPSKRGREVLKTLIPELVESEDERIRRELIEFIRWSEDRGMTRHDFHQAKRPSEWIAYLEKQKDSDMEFHEGYTLGFSDGVKSVEQKEPHYTKRNALFDKCVENCDPEVMKSVSDEVDKMLEKEQKPVDYEAELKKCKDNPLYFYDKYVSIKQKPAEINEYEIIKKHITEDVLSSEVNKRLKECGWYVTDEKPAEWSEFDKGVLKDAICATDILGNDANFNKGNPCLAKAFKVAKDWLKSLPERFNLQPKQEWSEEDEKDMAHIIRILDDCYAYGKHDLSKTDHENLTSTIKSLRPSWKPSAQELGALKTAVSVLTEERTFPKAAEQIQKIIDVFDGKELRKDWKPSEEQMEALNSLLCIGDFSYIGQATKLQELYIELKKL